MAADLVTLELPVDPRFVEVTLATTEALATRAGMDKADIAELREQVRAALSERLSQRGPGRVVLRYEVGEGFLGLRVDGASTGVIS